MTDTHAPAIVTEYLSKRYPEVTAVDSLNLELGAGLDSGSRTRISGAGGCVPAMQLFRK